MCGGVSTLNIEASLTSVKGGKERKGRVSYNGSIVFCSKRSSECLADVSKGAVK